MQVWGTVTFLLSGTMFLLTHLWNSSCFGNYILLLIPMKAQLTICFTHCSQIQSTPSHTPQQHHSTTQQCNGTSSVAPVYSFLILLSKSSKLVTTSHFSTIPRSDLTASNRSQIINKKSYLYPSQYRNTKVSKHVIL